MSETDVRKKLLMKVLSGCSPDTLVNSILQDFRVIPKSNLSFHFEPPMVFLGDKIIHLTNLESKVLSYLVKEAESPLTKSAILSSCWGWEYRQDYKTLHELIYRLRKKLEVNLLKPRMIITLPGTGYVFKYPNLGDA